jgi:hypothetical protein
MLDRQYRSLLDEPVPMLGNRTPRAAAGNNHFLEVRRTSRSLTLRTCHLVGAAIR